MIQTMNRLFIFAGLIIVLAACAPTSPITRPGIEDPRFIELERLLESGDYVQAALDWEGLAQDLPAERDALLIRAAEAWLKAGQFEQAELALGRIDTTHLDPIERVRFDLAQAELAMRRGDLANAGWLLASTAERLPRPLTERHAELEALLATLHAHPVRGAVQALRDALDEPDFSGELALALLLEFPLAELEGVLYEFGDDALLMPWLDLVLSARERLLFDHELEQALASWQQRWPDAGYSAAEAHEWIAAWRQTRPLPAQVTLLVPGPDTPLHNPGLALRDGVMAGWLAMPPNLRPRLDIRYTGAEAEAVVATWFDARESGSEFIIGPLERDKATLLASLPGAGLIPTLLLNLPDDPTELAAAGGEIAALALPPEAEAELAAIHALATGHRRAVILKQDTGWGDRLAEAFVETFILGGGQVLVERAYDPQAPDHSNLLRDMLALDRAQTRIDRLGRVLGEPVEALARPRTDIDVIFLASRATDGRLLIPQLEFFDAAGLTLMATSHIVDGAPQVGRDRDLDGVTTPIPPWFIDATEAGAVRRRAEGLFAGMDNPTLSRLHALGRDAIALLPWLEMMRADPRLVMPGMMGELSLPDGHVLQRDLPFIELRGGLARPLQVETGNRHAAARQR